MKGLKKILGCDDMLDEEYQEQLKLLHLQCLDKVYSVLVKQNPLVNRTVLHFAVFDELIKAKMFDIIDLICEVVEEEARS